MPFGSLDTPRPGEVLRGTAAIGGWALSENSIEQVTIYVDRTYAMTATLGGSRPDVGKIFTSIPGAERSGWNGVLDTTPFPPGYHEILVQARTKNGASRDIGTVTIAVAK